MPLAHAVWVHSRKLLHRRRCTPIRVALTEDGVHCAAHDRAVALLGIRCFRCLCIRRVVGNGIAEIAWTSHAMCGRDALLERAPRGEMDETGEISPLKHNVQRQMRIRCTRSHMHKRWVISVLEMFSLRRDIDR